MNKKHTTTVTLLKPADGDNQLHVFWCSDCANGVVQYKGEVIAIRPGGKNVQLPIIVQCGNNRCKRKYLFDYFVEELKN